MADPFYP